MVHVYRLDEKARVTTAEDFKDEMKQRMTEAKCVESDAPIRESKFREIHRYLTFEGKPVTEFVVFGEDCNRGYGR